MHHKNINNCCCTSEGRHFLTKEEKIKKLTEYKKWLDNESKGVEEAINELQIK
jgi:hypothetical protein